LSGLFVFPTGKSQSTESNALFQPTGNSLLCVNVAEMTLHRLLADGQFGRDFFVDVAGFNGRNDLYLARRQD